MREPVTLIQVAHAANVSPSTVSRILSGTAVVSETKRRRVLEAIERLNYTPNAMAQGLRSGQTMTIGMVAGQFGSAFYDEVFRGVEAHLAGTGYQVFFGAGHWRPDHERAALEAFLKWRVDALIILGGVMPDELLIDYAKRVPLVIVQRVVPSLEAQCVNVDNIHGGYLATRHLIDLGHRRIAHITGPSSNYEALGRQEGYRRALNEAGIPEDPALVVIEDTFASASGVSGTRQLLGRNADFTAIFAATDALAFGARLALHERNLQVPADVSLIGFDDAPDSRYILPPLSSVRQPAFEIGVSSVRLAIQLINGEPTPPPALDLVLIPRTSSAPPRSHPRLAGPSGSPPSSP